MTPLNAIKDLKRRGFSVRKAPNKSYYIVTYNRHGRLLIHRNLKYSEIADFAKEVKDDDKSFWREYKK